MDTKGHLTGGLGQVAERTTLFAPSCGYKFIRLGLLVCLAFSFIVLIVVLILSTMAFLVILKRFDKPQILNPGDPETLSWTREESYFGVGSDGGFKASGTKSFFICISIVFLTFLLFKLILTGFEYYAVKTENFIYLVIAICIELILAGTCSIITMATSIGYNGSLIPWLVLSALIPFTYLVRQGDTEAIKLYKINGEF